MKRWRRSPRPRVPSASWLPLPVDVHNFPLVGHKAEIFCFASLVPSIVIDIQLLCYIWSLSPQACKTTMDLYQIVKKHWIWSRAILFRFHFSISVSISSISLTNKHLKEQFMFLCFHCAFQPHTLWMGKVGHVSNFLSRTWQPNQGAALMIS